MNRRQFIAGGFSFFLWLKGAQAAKPLKPSVLVYEKFRRQLKDAGIEVVTPERRLEAFLDLGSPMTPQDVDQAADLFARTLRTMPKHQQDHWMDTMKRVNPVVHARARAKLRG